MKNCEDIPSIDGIVEQVVQNFTPVSLRVPKELIMPMTRVEYTLEEFEKELPFLKRIEQHENLHKRFGISKWEQNVVYMYNLESQSV